MNKESLLSFAKGEPLEEKYHYNVFYEVEPNGNIIITSVYVPNTNGCSWFGIDATDSRRDTLNEDIEKAIKDYLNSGGKVSRYTEQASVDRETDEHYIITPMKGASARFAHSEDEVIM